VFDERRCWFVHAPTHLEMAPREVSTTVPIAPRMSVVRATPDMHEAHATLEQAPPDEAARAEVFRDFLVESVEFLRQDGFAGNIQDFGSAELQFGGKLVRSNASVEP